MFALERKYSRTDDYDGGSNKVIFDSHYELVSENPVPDFVSKKMYVTGLIFWALIEDSFKRRFRKLVPVKVARFQNFLINNLWCLIRISCIL